MVKFLNFFFFSLLFFSSLEFVARVLPYFTRVEIHQDYSIKAKGPSYHPFSNGRGARGKWPDDRKVALALFGSSIAEQRDMRYEQTWPYLLEQKFSDAVYIDSFAAGSLKARGIVSLVNDLARRGIRYDAVILNVTLFRGDDRYPLERLYSGSYYNRFTVPQSDRCHFCHLAIDTFWQWLEVSAGPENFMKLLRYLEKPSVFAPVPANTLGYNPVKRNRFRSEGRLVFYDPDIDEVELKNITRINDNLLTHLKKITDHIIWIPEITYYSPKMRQSYFESFVTIIPKKYMEPDSPDGYYLDEKSLFLRTYKRYKIMEPMMQAAGVTEIKWFEDFTARIETEDGLTRDEYHLTPKGAIAFSDIIYPQLRETLSSALDQKAK